MMEVTDVMRSASLGDKSSWSTNSIPGLLEDTPDVATPLKEVRRKDVRRESVGPVLMVQQRRDSVLEDKKGRRKSWHPKLERKRRKGVVAPTSPNGNSDQLPTINHQRQKRPSWWNIFVPDHWPSGRSRRASQDVGRVYKSSENVVPWLRSKSRSVDHGVSPPFDIDALRSKVEGRFESVDKFSKDGNDSESASLTEKKKSGPPPNTQTYTVQDRDTLTSVAARFDTTPSELTKLNRLGTPFIFPGQQLYVPLREKGEEESETVTPTEEELPPEEKELLDNLRPVSPKPGHAERVRTPLGAPTSASQDNEEEAFHERFLKINVRHITDGQGVVGGVLLVTSNAVMFDPNVSDPLVIEHGPESYGVIAPLEFVVNAAIYYDIAHMRVGNSTSEHHNSNEPKPEIYYMKSCETHSPGKDSLLVKDETFPELVTGGDDAESVCSCADRDRDGDAFPKAFERDLVTPTNIQTETDEHHRQKSAEEDENDDILKQEIRTAEERRKSMLDHHWAIPSKDRSMDGPDDTTPPSSAMPTIRDDEPEVLTKQSCHDSGIDIRDPVPVVQPIPTKKVYSDAEIVLSNDWVPPVTIVPTNITTTQPEVSSPGGRKKTSSVSFSLDSSVDGEPGQIQGKDDADKQETKKNKMLKRLSYPIAWMENLAGEKEEPSSTPHSADSGQHSSVFSKVFSRRSSVGTFIRQPTSSSDSSKHSKPAAPKLDYRSMVSVEDMPELFVSFDKLIPRPARSCDDPPLYLRLRMGKPIGRIIPRSTPIMSYGKKKMRPEYWFSVPRNRVDELYKYLQLRVPHLYGELCPEEVKARGFELVESDTELWEDDSSGQQGSRHSSQDGEISELTRESWENIPMSDELRRALYANSAISLDVEIVPPDLVGTTEILQDEHREKLCRHLPARAEGYVWTLVFSTSQHGFSLNSMYRKMNKLESPILLVIEDTEHNVFGALTSCAFKVSDHFYGTGESLLFRFTPEFQVFNWTGENLYFIKGNNESLSIGAGDGKFGLWLDGDLNQGRTETCRTYGNEPLTPTVDFVVKTLECWAFIQT